MAQEYAEKRQRTLTDADIEAVAVRLADHHTCRFENITTEDMTFLKDLLTIYKETRSEVIKWIVKGIIYGTLLLIAVAGYFKVKS